MSGFAKCVHLKIIQEVIDVICVKKVKSLKKKRKKKNLKKNPKKKIILIKIKNRSLRKSEINGITSKNT